MKSKTFILVFIFLYCVIIFSKIISNVDEKSAKVEYYPFDEKIPFYDFEYENGYLIKNIYINVPEGDVEIYVKGEGKKEGKNFFTGLNKAEKLYEKHFVYASKQRILQLKIFPVYKFDKEMLQLYNKISIEIKFKNQLFKSPSYNPLLSTSVNSNFVSPSQVSIFSKSDEPKIKSYLKLEIKDDGLYRVDYTDLKNAGLTPEFVSPNNLGLYRRKNLILPADTSNMFYYKDPIKVPIKFFGDDDNSFEKGEYFIFYGNSIKGKGKNFYLSYDLFNNPFTDYNQYILVFNDSNFIEISNLEYDSVKGDSFANVLITFRYDSINPLMAGYGWAWREFSVYKDSTDQQDYLWNFKLNNLADSTGKLFVSFFFQTDLNDTFDIDIELNGKIIGRASARGAYTTIPKSFSFDVTNFQKENSIRIIPVNTDNKNKVFYLCSIEPEYKAFLGGDEDLKIENNQKEILTVKPQENLFCFLSSAQNSFLGKLEKNKQFNIKTFNSNEIYFSKNLKKVDQFEYVDCSTVFDFNDGCDILVITGKGYKNSVNSYVQYRKKNGLSVKVFEFDQIDNAFSFGMRTPTSIKSFLYYAQKKWAKFPNYLLLLGSGSFDYKNRLNTFENRSVVPVYETGYGVYKLALLTSYRSECVDRWYTLLDGDNYIDLIPGRITVYTKDQAYYALNKIIDYETKTPTYIKSRSVMISDDEYSSRLTSDFNDISFINASEELSNLLGNIFAIEKLYLTDYKGDLEKTEHWPYNPGFKRDVRFVLKDILSRGVNFGFFYGHGSYYSLTHEHFLEYPTDLDLFDNIYKYPIFLFGTCQAGQFDNDYGCIAGDFQILPYSGFSATIAATRATGADENRNILYLSFVYDLFLYGGYKTVGEYYLAMINKNNYTYTSHQLFGDPSMVVKKYKYDIDIISQDTITLGTNCNIGFSYNYKNDEKVFLDIYQPFYVDSHDYLHTYPYSYIYYVKDDGIMRRMSDNKKERIFEVILPDTFENKKYLSRLNIVSIFEDDSFIHSKVKKVFYKIEKDTSFSMGELIVKVNGIEVFDTVLASEKYKLGIEFVSKKGIYLANITGFKPSVNINQDKKIIVNNFIVVEDTFKTEIFIDSAYSMIDTLKVVVFDNNLKKYEKTVFIKHPQTNLTKNILVYPNPFNDNFYITFNSNSAGFLTYKIFNDKGNILDVGKENFKSGFNSILVDIKNKRKLLPGVYLLSIDINDFSEGKRYFKNLKIVKK
ncbi:MAG: C25 family cysteine peptidase [candidate division WOR-3 bacterium]